jgi:hypothetical protein
MNRKIRSVCAAFIFSLTGLPVWAKSQDFVELMQTLPCAAEVRTQLPAKLQRQTWVATAFSWPDLPLAEGIVFRDTIERKGYRLGPKGEKKAVLSEFPLFVKKGQSAQQQSRVWDAEKNCVAEAYTEAYDDVVVPIARLSSIGFDDDDLKKLLETNDWGLIYLTSFHPGTIPLYKDVKMAAERKGGHFTVLTFENYSFNVSDLKLVVTFLREIGIDASDLRPLASRELFERVGIHTNYPRIFVYRKGFLANRALDVPRDAELAIQRQLDDLRDDMKSD